MQHTIYLKPTSSTTAVDVNGTELKDKNLKKFKDTLDKAIREGRAIKCVFDDGGVLTKVTTTTAIGVDLISAKPIPEDIQRREVVIAVNVPKEQATLMNFVHTECESLKPEVLKMTPLKWKYLIRSAMRGKNIMMTGPAGCGKTMAAKSLVNALNRPEFYFNLGATQDPRGTLVGNTHYNNEDGTYFSESLFVKAIQTPDAVILMDELSRAHPEAWNILMTVLDEGQRYLRLDEKDGSPTIKVAPGVCFVATANIGNEYTSTRVMDKALMDRFTIVEMDLLDQKEESSLLKYLYPKASTDAIDNICGITDATRKEIVTENPRIGCAISTRIAVEMASLVYDGFTIEEAVEVAIYPQYDDAGGIDSERTFVKQIVQKFCDDGSEEDLFNVDDMD